MDNRGNKSVIKPKFNQQKQHKKSMILIFEKTEQWIKSYQKTRI